MVAACLAILLMAAACGGDDSTSAPDDGDAPQPDEDPTGTPEPEPDEGDDDADAEDEDPASDDDAGEPSIVSDAPVEDPDLIIPTISQSSILLPRFMVEHEALFDKHGLNVETVQVDSTRFVDLYVSGEFTFGLMQAESVPIIVSTGEPVEVHLVSQFRSNYSLWVQPEIDSIEELEGRTVGISGFGGRPHVTTLLTFEKFGVDEDTVTFQPLQNVGAIVQAMVAGQVDAGMFGSPSTVVAAREGLKELLTADEVDLPEMGLPLGGNPDWISQNPNTAKAFMRAWIEGIWIAHTDPDRAKAALAAGAELDPVEDAEIIDAGYDEVMLMFVDPREGGDVEAHLESLWAKYEEREEIEDESVILPSDDLFGELVEEGFFEALEAEYGPLPDRG